jgi:hypothetical protein
MLTSLISILLLWIGVFWLYRDYCVDVFRQRMFRIRDELFDDARRGAISFDHPTYGILRTLMNGCVRFAHVLNLVEFGFFAWRAQSQTDFRFSSKLSESMENLTSEQKAVYFRYMHRINMLVLRYILLGSPIIFVTVVLPIALYILIRHFIDAMLSILREPLDRIDGLAFVAGEDR